MSDLQVVDPEVAQAVAAEVQRQQEGIELIASENLCLQPCLRPSAPCSPTNMPKVILGVAIMVAASTSMRLSVWRSSAPRLCLAQKRRMCSLILARKPIWQVYMAELKPGDSVLAMSLDHGGHLTHGSPVNFSGRLYDAHAYGINETTGLLDYDVIAEQARQTQPKMIIAGASAYSRENLISHASAPSLMRWKRSFARRYGAYRWFGGVGSSPKSCPSRRLCDHDHS